jgi:hypothetical protein
MKKLSLIVPYRKRESHLRKFIPYMEDYLNKSNIPFSIVVVEQNNGKPFNRGMLLNIGYDLSTKDSDYFCFHDVDLIPDDVDYSYTEHPVHLATNLSKDEFRDCWEYYFGGVTLFNKQDFININGYSNEYWGWGFEDDDLLRRCVNFGLKVDEKEVKSPVTYGLGSGYFNGTTSHCEVMFGNKEMREIFSEDFTILTNFLPDKVMQKENVSECIWSIPELGFNLLFSDRGSLDLVATNIDGEKFVCQQIYRMVDRIPTLSIISYDSNNNRLNFYINGELIDFVEIDMKKIDEQESMYLGVENPEGHPNKYFYKGQIFEHAVYDRKLSEREVKDLFLKRRGRSLTQDFNSYKPHKLCCYYDFNHHTSDYYMDLSNNKVRNFKTDVMSGVLNEDSYFVKRIIKKLPFRRKSKFLSLFHQTEGWVGKGWKQPETYINQRHYFNIENKIDIVLNDGLSNLEYKVDNYKDITEYSKLYKVSFNEST